jgi:hypothetical protein
MKKLITFLCILYVLIQGCTNETNDWLTDYQRVKCAYKNVEDTQRKDSSDFYNSEGYKMLEKKINLYTRPFTEKISHYKDEIIAANKVFKEQYRKVTDQHNIEYGHVSTPHYERKIAELENERSKKISQCEKEIEHLLQKVEADPKVKEARNKLKTLRFSFENQTKELSLKKDSLQEELNELNRLKKHLVAKLKDGALDSFNKKVEAVKLNPCNFNRR